MALAFQPSVIQPALLVGTAAEVTFKSRVGGDYAHFPSGMTLQQQTQLPVECTATFLIAEAFAIGRIAKKNPFRLRKL